MSQINCDNNLKLFFVPWSFVPCDNFRTVGMTWDLGGGGGTTPPIRDMDVMLGFTLAIATHRCTSKTVFFHVRLTTRHIKILCIFTELPGIYLNYSKNKLLWYDLLMSSKWRIKCWVEDRVVSGDQVFYSVLECPYTLNILTHPMSYNMLHKAYNMYF